jgi:hypothetical protein
MGLIPPRTSRSDISPILESDANPNLSGLFLFLLTYRDTRNRRRGPDIQIRQGTLTVSNGV